MTKLLAVFFAWVVVYTAVTLALLAFEWAQVEAAMPLRTLLITVVLVPSMVFLIGPLSGKAARHILLKFG
ncbi:hypothetical protein [Flexibacterium corallicola]|uniref:hypothetical protein n=1 Tax=Flexibacterium corallicola TaxID=3037259 RepID=UPI00286EF1EF|nr:hypothetical protein [Pseudovibrio sp. M1P-2-3]